MIVRMSMEDSQKARKHLVNIPAVYWDVAVACHPLDLRIHNKPLPRGTYKIKKNTTWVVLEVPLDKCVEKKW